MADITNRDSKYATNKSTQGGLLDVLLALKANIMKATNVATLAEVQSIDTTNLVVKVKPFPLINGENEKTIDCYSCMFPTVKEDNIKWSNLVDSLSKKDIVLVVFLNRNSSQNLKQARKNQVLTTLKENSELHSDKFGIVVGIVYKGGINNGI